MRHYQGYLDFNADLQVLKKKTDDAAKEKASSDLSKVTQLVRNVTMLHMSMVDSQPGFNEEALLALQEQSEEAAKLAAEELRYV